MNSTTYNVSPILEVKMACNFSQNCSRVGKTTRVTDQLVSRSGRGVLKRAAAPKFVVIKSLQSVTPTVDDHDLGNKLFEKPVVRNVSRTAKCRRFLVNGSTYSFKPTSSRNLKDEFEGCVKLPSSHNVGPVLDNLEEPKIFGQFKPQMAWFESLVASLPGVPAVKVGLDAESMGFLDHMMQQLTGLVNNANPQVDVNIKTQLDPILDSLRSACGSMLETFLNAWKTVDKRVLAVVSLVFLLLVKANVRDSVTLDVAIAGISVYAMTLTVPCSWISKMFSLVTRNGPNGSIAPQAFDLGVAKTIIDLVLEGISYVMCGYTVNMSRSCHSILQDFARIQNTVKGSSAFMLGLASWLHKCVTFVADCFVKDDLAMMNESSALVQESLLCIENSKKAVLAGVPRIELVATCERLSNELMRKINMLPDSMPNGMKSVKARLLELHREVSKYMVAMGTGTAVGGDRDVPFTFMLSGASSTGKTTATSLIAKELLYYHLDVDALLPDGTLMDVSKLIYNVLPECKFWDNLSNDALCMMFNDLFQVKPMPGAETSDCASIIQLVGDNVFTANSAIAERKGTIRPRPVLVCGSTNTACCVSYVKNVIAEPEAFARRFDDVTYIQFVAERYAKPGEASNNRPTGVAASDKWYSNRVDPEKARHATRLEDVWQYRKINWQTGELYGDVMSYYELVAELKRKFRQHMDHQRNIKQRKIDLEIERQERLLAEHVARVAEAGVVESVVQQPYLVHNPFMEKEEEDDDVPPPPPEYYDIVAEYYHQSGSEQYDHMAEKTYFIRDALQWKLNPATIMDGVEEDSADFKLRSAYKLVYLKLRSLTLDAKNLIENTICDHEALRLFSLYNGIPNAVTYLRWHAVQMKESFMDFVYAGYDTAMAYGMIASKFVADHPYLTLAAGVITCGALVQYFDVFGKIAAWLWPITVQSESFAVELPKHDENINTKIAANEYRLGVRMDVTGGIEVHLVNGFFLAGRVFLTVHHILNDLLVRHKYCVERGGTLQLTLTRFGEDAPTFIVPFDIRMCSDNLAFADLMAIYMPPCVPSHKDVTKFLLSPSDPLVKKMRESSMNILLHRSTGRVMTTQGAHGEVQYSGPTSVSSQLLAFNVPVEARKYYHKNMVSIPLATRDGECGTLGTLIDNGRKLFTNADGKNISYITYFHVAGNGRQGLGILLTKAILTKLDFKQFGLSPDDAVSLLRERFIDTTRTTVQAIRGDGTSDTFDDVVARMKPPSAEATPNQVAIGEIELGSISGKSSIVKSPAYRALQAFFEEKGVVTRPAKLAHFVNNAGEVVNPSVNGFSNFGHNSKQVEHMDKIEYVVENFVSMSGMLHVVDPKPQCYAAAVGGPLMGGTNKINIKSSIGFEPKLAGQPGPSKKAIFGDGALVDLDNEAAKNFRAGVEALLEEFDEFGVDVNYVACLKDEVLKLKAETGEVKAARVFYITSLINTVMQMYFGNMIDAFTKHRVRNGGCIGINMKDPEEVTRLVNVLLSIGSHVLCSDMEKYDKSICEALIALFDMYQRHVHGDADPHANRVRAAIIASIKSGFVVRRENSEGHVYFVRGGLYSGLLLTSILGTVINLLTTHISLMYIANADWPSLPMAEYMALSKWVYKNSAVLCYGDDNLSTNVIPGFTADKFFGVMFEKFGLKLTNECDDTNEIGMVPIEQAQFLARSFRPVLIDGNLKYLAPLRLVSIAKQFSWDKNDLTASDRLLKWHNAIVELSLHDEATFNEWMSALSPVLRESSYSDSYELLSYATTQRMSISVPCVAGDYSQD